MKTITRFAPSPTGPLHLGHAHSALFGWTAARDRGGVFLLRIEDIDSGRCRPEFERQLMDDMSWLGLTWPDPVRRQSEHFDDYRAALDRLEALGVTYSCFCTRKEIEGKSPVPAMRPTAPTGRSIPEPAGISRPPSGQRVKPPVRPSPSGWT